MENLNDEKVKRVCREWRIDDPLVAGKLYEAEEAGAVGNQEVAEKLLVEAIELEKVLSTPASDN